MRVNDSVKSIKSRSDRGRGGSRPKPPRAVARSASLEAPRPLSDNGNAKRRLTDKTVAQAITLVSVPGRQHLQAPFVVKIVHAAWQAEALCAKRQFVDFTVVANVADDP